MLKMLSFNCCSFTTHREDKMAKLFVKTFGCEPNQADAALLVANYISRGYVLVQTAEQAELILLQSCGLSKERETALLSELEACKLASPNAEIVIGGCLPAMSPNLLNWHDHGLKLISPSKLARNKRKARDNEQWFFIDRSGTAHIRISTGCMDRCSYCSIWKAAGRTISRNVSEIIDDLERARLLGAKTAYLISEDCGAWGRDRGETLNRLFSALKTKGDTGLKVTLGTLHPRWLPETQLDLEKAMNQGVLVPHLMIPIQSGSQRMLGAMSRGYSAKEITRRLLAMKERVANLRLGTDVLIGYDSETDEDISATLAMLTTVEFDTVSIYAYHSASTTPPPELASRVGFLARELLLADYIKSGETSWKAYIERLALTPEKPVMYQSKWIGKTLGLKGEKAMKTRELARVMAAIMHDQTRAEAAITDSDPVIAGFAREWLDTDLIELDRELNRDHI